MIRATKVSVEYERKLAANEPLPTTIAEDAANGDFKFPFTRTPKS